MASAGNMDYSKWSKPDAVMKVSILLLLGTNVVAGYREHHASAKRTAIHISGFCTPAPSSASLMGDFPSTTLSSLRTRLLHSKSSGHPVRQKCGDVGSRAPLDVSSGVGLGFGVGRRQTLDNYSARQKISRQGAIRVPPVFVDTMTFKDQEDVPPLISTVNSSAYAACSGKPYSREQTPKLTCAEIIGQHSRIRKHQFWQKRKTRTVSRRHRALLIGWALITLVLIVVSRILADANARIQALQSFCNSMNETLGDMRQKIDRLENRLADVSNPTVLTTA